MAVVLLVLALCRPVSLLERDDAHVLFLVDVSESVNLDAALEVLDLVEAAVSDLRPKDSYDLAVVADGCRVVENAAALRALIVSWQEAFVDDEFRQASRLEESLREARLRFPASKAKRVVLFSDGHETHGDLALALSTLAQEGIDVRWHSLESLAEAEAAVVALEASSASAYEGETVRLRVDVAANRAMEARLRLVHQGVVAQEQAVSLKAGTQRIDVDVPMLTSGDGVWVAEIVSSADHFPLNNQLRTTVKVIGKPRVLALHEESRELRNFVRAMKQQEIEIEVRGVRGLPESLEEMLAFDAILFSDIPATALTESQMALVKRYVMDFGGGVAMVGSENSFGLGGYYQTPVEEVLPLVSRFEKEKQKPSLAMVLVIDKSGSMQGLPITLARQAAKASVELLGARDQMGVIGFDGEPQIVSELRAATESAAIHAGIDSLSAGGGTDVYRGMLAGKELLDHALAKIKHMIVLTDGQTSDADFVGLLQAMNDRAITVSTVALGEEAARELLASIAELGRGRYYETMDPASVPQIFTKETMQASKSAIKEDLYAPVIVGNHALLSGYAEEELPFVLGYVMTEPKPTARVLLGLETGDPLLALGNYGLGKGMAFTADLTERWGSEWLAWADGGRFWAQALRTLLRRADTQGMEVVTSVQDQSRMWSVDVRRVDVQQRPLAGITWEAQALDEQGREQAVEVRETGLGRYAMRVPLGDHEQLTLRLRDRDHDLVKVLHYHRPYPREYMLGDEIPEALRQTPAFEMDALLEGLQPSVARTSLTPWVAFGALAFTLLGLLLRRL